MSATVLVHGKMFRSAERKTSRADKPYVAATMRDGQGNDAVWWRVMAFHEPAIGMLMSIRDGESFAVNGTLKAELYEKSGEARISLTVMADSIITAKVQKRDKAAESRTDRKAAAEQSPDARPFDDTIPF